MLTRRTFNLGLGASLLYRLAQAAETPDALLTECQRLESQLAARLGVCWLDTGTGRLTSHRGAERFPMCSTFKSLLTAAVLKRVDDREENLRRRVRYAAGDLVTYSPVTERHVGPAGMTVGELCEATMTVSDNSAANLLLQTVGGPTGLTAFVRTLGDSVTRLDRWETELNEATPGDPRDTTSPEAMARNFAQLALESTLSEDGRQQWIDWLVANQTGDARLRSGLPKEWKTGDKTGTGGHGSMNDVAIVWPPGRAPMVLAMYITQTRAEAAQKEAAFGAVARLLR